MSRGLIDIITLLMVCLGPFAAVIILGRRHTTETGNRLGASIAIYIFISSLLLLAWLRPRLFVWLLG
jgi:hypothetical protein